MNVKMRILVRPMKLINSCLILLFNNGFRMLPGVRSCYDEGKRTAETLAMDYHRGAGVQVGHFSSDSCSLWDICASEYSNFVCVHNFVAGTGRCEIVNFNRKNRCNALFLGSDCSDFQHLRSSDVHR